MVGVPALRPMFLGHVRVKRASMPRRETRRFRRAWGRAAWRVTVATAGLGAMAMALVIPAAGEVSPPGNPPAATAPDRFDEGIEILKKTLYRRQDAATGGWFGAFDATPAFDAPVWDGWLSVLATRALLASGERPDAVPALRSALEYLELLQREHGQSVVGTQPVGLRADVWAALPQDRYRTALRRDLRQLSQGAGHRGTFAERLDEPPAADSKYHLRMTYFGALGLSAGIDDGAEVSKRYWQDLAAFMVETQRDDGGWSIRPDSTVNAEATAAALVTLHLAERGLIHGGHNSPAAVREALSRGHALLSRSISEDKNIFGGAGYLLYALQQLARLNGQSRYGNDDWFNAASRYALDRIHRPSDPVHQQVVNSAYFLMLLSEIRSPAMIQRLTLDGGYTGLRHPYELHTLTRTLSQAFEREIDWRWITAQDPVPDWLAVPVTYLPLNAPLEPTEAQARAIHDYLDRGGLLVVAAETSDRRVGTSIGKLLKDHYGEAITERAVGPDHPVLSLWRPVPRPVPVTAYGNGARDLVFVVQDRLGDAWQSGGRRAEAAVQLAGNLIIFATGYEPLRPRTLPPAAETTPRATTAAREAHKPLVVAVASPVAGFAEGRWEPALWSRFAPPPGRTLRTTRMGLDMAGSDVQIDGVVQTPDLLHLVGVDAATLDEATLKRIQTFIDAGGTVLVETLGGLGEFAASLENQFAELYRAPAERLVSRDPFFGDADAEPIRVGYRAMTIRQFQYDNRPRLACFRVNGRPAVLFSREDLSLASLGVAQWGIHGYDRASAETLLSHVVAAALNTPEP